MSNQIDRSFWGISVLLGAILAAGCGQSANDAGQSEPTPASPQAANLSRYPALPEKPTYQVVLERADKLTEEMVDQALASTENLRQILSLARERDVVRELGGINFPFPLMILIRHSGLESRGGQGELRLQTPESLEYIDFADYRQMWNDLSHIPNLVAWSRQLLAAIRTLEGDPSLTTAEHRDLAYVRESVEEAIGRLDNVAQRLPIFAEILFAGAQITAGIGLFPTLETPFSPRDLSDFHGLIKNQAVSDPSDRPRYLAGQLSIHQFDQLLNEGLSDSDREHVLKHLIYVNIPPDYLADLLLNTGQVFPAPYQETYNQVALKLQSIGYNIRLNDNVISDISSWLPASEEPITEIIDPAEIELRLAEWISQAQQTQEKDGHRYISASDNAGDRRLRTQAVAAEAALITAVKQRQDPFLSAAFLRQHLAYQIYITYEYIEETTRKGPRQALTNAMNSYQRKFSQVEQIITHMESLGLPPLKAPAPSPRLLELYESQFIIAQKDKDIISVGSPGSFDEIRSQVIHTQLDFFEALKRRPDPLIMANHLLREYKLLGDSLLFNMNQMAIPRDKGLADLEDLRAKEDEVIALRDQIVVQ